MSSIPSVPTESRTKPGSTPAASCSSSESCACVVDAGWITRDRTSPMFATWECRLSASTNAIPASLPPSSTKPSTEPAPRGAYFRARSCHGEDGRPA